MGEFRAGEPPRKITLFHQTGEMQYNKRFDQSVSLGLIYFARHLKLFLLILMVGGWVLFFLGDPYKLLLFFRLERTLYHFDFQSSSKYKFY